MMVHSGELAKSWNGCHRETGLIVETVVEETPVFHRVSYSTV